MAGNAPRPLYAAIGATEESARAQILAVGPDSLESLSPNVGDVLSWDGTAWVPTPGAGLGVNGGLIFRPGGTATVGVVVTEASLQAAVAAYPGPVTVMFDDSVTSPIHLTIPWTVSYSMRWWGKRLGSATDLVLDDGFVLSGPGGFLGVSSVGNGLRVQAEGLVGPSPLPVSLPDVLLVEEGSSLTSGGAFPLVSIGDAVSLSLRLQGTLGDGANPVLSLGLGSGLVAYLYETSVLRDLVLLGADPGSSAFFQFLSPAVGSASLLNPGFLGAITSSLESDSSLVSYNDALVSPPLGSGNVQGALDALKSLVVSGGGSSAIWRANGAPTAPGIFNTWAALFAWIQAAPGSKHVFLDGSFGALEVDPGLWTFTPPVEFIGSPTGSRTTLVLNESAFRNVWRWSRIRFEVENILTVPFGQFSDTIEFMDCEVDLSGGAQPFIRTLTATMDVTFRHMPVFPTTQLVFDMQPTAPNCTLRLLDGTSVAVNSFGTAVGTTLTIFQDTTSLYVDQFFIFGTLIRQLSSSQYIPAIPANWTFPNPTTVSEALDKLSAKFVSSSLGPV